MNQKQCIFFVFGFNQLVKATKNPVLQFYSHVAFFEIHINFDVCAISLSLYLYFFMGVGFRWSIHPDND